MAKVDKSIYSAESTEPIVPAIDRTTKDYANRLGTLLTLIKCKWKPGNVTDAINAAKELGDYVASKILTSDDGFEQLKKMFEDKKMDVEKSWDDVLRNFLYSANAPLPEHHSFNHSFPTTAANDNEYQTPKKPPLPLPVQLDPTPFAPDKRPGLLGAIAQFAMDTAYRPSLEFSMMAAIAFLSALSNRRYITPSGHGMNIYLFGLSPPSFGKEHPQKLIKVLAKDAGLIEALLGPGEVSSSAAIEMVVRAGPNCLMVWDEIGIMLQGMNGKNAGHAETIRKALLELFTKSQHGNFWTGKRTADDKKDNSVIYSPTISLFGFSTTTEFYKGLPVSASTDGFLARVLIVQVETRGERQKTSPKLIPPPALLEAIKNFSKEVPTNGNLAGVTFRTATGVPYLHAVPWADDEADAEMEKIEAWQEATIDDDASQYGIVGRASELTQKLAAIQAISRKPSDPRLTVEDVRWGFTIVHRSLSNVESGVRLFMADSEHERLGKAIVEAVRKAGKPVHESHLIRGKGISKFDKRMRNSAIEDLITTGQIRRAGRDGKAFELGLE